MLIKAHRTSDRYRYRTKKLNLLYEGPYKIVGKKSKNAYTLIRNVGKNTATINARRLRPYFKSTTQATPIWETEESDYRIEDDEAIILSTIISGNTYTNFSKDARDIEKQYNSSKKTQPITMELIKEKLREIEYFDNKVLSLLNEEKSVKIELINVSRKILMTRAVDSTCQRRKCEVS